MIPGSVARVVGPPCIALGLLVAAEADAGWRSRRDRCCPPPDCVETVRVESGCCRPVERGCRIEERWEPRVHHHVGCDACGRRVCVEHVTMQRVRVAMPPEDVVVWSEVAPAASVCCSD